MAKACVTGAAGFIGGHLVDGLLEQGLEVVGLDDYSSGKRENVERLEKKPGFKFIEGSITDRAAVDAAMRSARYVFHLAAIPSVPVSVNEPERTNFVNVGGTLQVLEAARREKVERVVLSCSCAAYGDGPEQPKHERLPPLPTSPYAAQKVACELYAQTYSRVYGLPCVSLRYFNVFGPRQDPKSDYAAAIPKFATRLLAGQSPIVFGDGLQTRDFVYVTDVVRANWLAATLPAEKVSGAVINIGSGHSATLLELIQLIQKAVGPEAQALKVEHQAPRAGDIRTSSSDLTLARTLLGYAPQVTLEQGLAQVVASIRAESRGRSAA